MKTNKEDDDLTVCITDKPLDMPIQNVEAPTMSHVEKLEENYFINKIPEKRHVFFRGLYRYQNPIHKEDPLNKGENDPEIYAVNITNSNLLLILSKNSSTCGLTKTCISCISLS